MPTDARVRRGRAGRLIRGIALLPLWAATVPHQVAAEGGPPPTGLVERVLAAVDGGPVLLSDTRAVARVRGVSEAVALELLIDETLMYEQASRTPQAAVTREEEERARGELLETGKGPGGDVPEAALARLLRRQITILKYVDFRFRPQVRPSDEDLQRAYAEEYRGREDAPAFETVSEALRERLGREKLGQRVEAWVRELRADADVRLVKPRGPPE